MSAVEPAAIDAPAAQAEPTRLGLFLTFFQIGICGFGGVGPWARRIIVEERGWLDDRQYAELLGLCQVLPGPNVGNVSVMVGDRFYGLAGSILAFTGLMSGPMSILFVLAYLYDRFGELAYVNAAIGGVAAAAAGLFLGTALKIAERLKLTAPALALTATAFVAVGLLHWPLIYVVLALAPVGILLAWRAQW
ncbi:MAG: chromate transporter [Chloroflexota bacterium]